MKNYLRFVSVGLVLGLFTEFVFRLIFTVNPKAFMAAVLLYPVILTLAYAAHKIADRLISSQWRGDVLHYLACGLCGLGSSGSCWETVRTATRFNLGCLGCGPPSVLGRAF